jgi:hypothetical protein
MRSSKPMSRSYAFQPGLRNRRRPCASLRGRQGVRAAGRAALACAVPASRQLRPGRPGYARSSAAAAIGTEAGHCGSCIWSSGPESQAGKSRVSVETITRQAVDSPGIAVTMSTAGVERLSRTMTALDSAFVLDTGELAGLPGLDTVAYPSAGPEPLTPAGMDGVVRRPAAAACSVQ